MNIFAVAIFLTLLGIAYPTESSPGEPDLLHGKMYKFSSSAASNSIKEQIKQHLPKDLATCLVSFQKDAVHKCSGALICADYALGITSCEELRTALPHEIGVVIGVINQKNKEYRTVVDKVPVKGSKELILARLDGEVIQTEKISATALAHQTFPYGCSFQAVILGKYEPPAQLAPSVLTNADFFVPALPQNDDIGGLLFYREALLGITSGARSGDNLRFVNVGGDEKIRILNSMSEHKSTFNERTMCSSSTANEEFASMS